MKFFKRFKFIVLTFNLILVFCGFLFIGKFLKKEKTYKKENIIVNSIENKELIDELSKCKSDLFVIKNELEQLKFVPDSRRDIIKLLLVMRDIEQNIGKKVDFSANCVDFFSLTSRIPVIQEYVLKYKDQMFKNNCNFANNKMIIKMISSFQIEFIKNQQNDEKKSTWYKQLLSDIKYQISKLFIKSRIKKSDIEIAVEEYDYDNALSILMENDFKKTDEYNELYSAISSLKNIKQMINGIYDILRTKN